MFGGKGEIRLKFQLSQCVNLRDLNLSCANGVKHIHTCLLSNGETA